MSERSGKHALSVGLLHVYCCPSMTSSGNPLTSDCTPPGRSAVTSLGRQPRSTPNASASAVLVRPVWLNSTQSGPKAIQPWLSWYQASGWLLPVCASGQGIPPPTASP